MRYPILYNTDKVVVEVNRIRSLRKEKDMKQAELAAMLQCAPTAVSKYELGQLDISSDTICKLCDIFGYSAPRLTVSGPRGPEFKSPHSDHKKAWNLNDSRLFDILRLKHLPWITPEITPGSK